MSGYDRQGVAQIGTSREDVACMEKPFTAEHLLTRVRQVLDDVIV